jgi:AcrR family transcriptional regulator
MTQLRGERAERLILAAARDLLADGGVQGLTIEGVAARAGVAKTTIYRRWSSKEDLALAVLVDMVAQLSVVPDLGNTYAELFAFVSATVHVLGSTLMGRVMQGLVSELAANPELAEKFRERVVAARMAEAVRIIERGVDRGDLQPGIEHDVAQELLFGPVYYRLFFSGTPVDDSLARNVVDVFTRAFAPAR